MRALVIGATGATGKDLLELLLKDDEFEQIDVFVRRDLDFCSKKLNIHVIDFEKPEQWIHLVKGDVLFSCLGTTLKVAGSKDVQWKIDYDYQFQFAKAARENNVRSYILVSSSNASAKSRVFYAKMKGQLEEDVKTLNFPKLIIFRPSILVRKDSDRKFEVFGANMLKCFNSIGLFRSNTPMQTNILAAALIGSLKVLEDGFFYIKAQEIKGYASN